MVRVLTLTLTPADDRLVLGVEDAQRARVVLPRAHLVRVRVRLRVRVRVRVRVSPNVWYSPARTSAYAKPSGGSGAYSSCPPPYPSAASSSVAGGACLVSPGSRRGRGCRPASACPALLWPSHCRLALVSMVHT